jgi:replicative DNA helicase
MQDNLKEEILEYFQGHSLDFYQAYGAQNFKKQGKEWFCCCPLHHETKPSFAVNEQGQWYCHAEKIGGDLFDFYAKTHDLNVQADFSRIVQDIASDFSIGNGGGQQQEKAPPPWERPIERVYRYKDAKGRDHSLVVRFKDGLHPRFMQGRPKKGGGIDWGLKGQETILYRLPEVLKAKEVIITEGEKDADNVKALGLTATTSPMGAGKWREKFNEALRGKDIVLCPDNDEEGKKHMAQVGKSLQGVAKSIKLLDLPGLSEKQDISDWIERFGDKQEAAERLSILIENAEPFQSGESKSQRIAPLSPDQTSILPFLDSDPEPVEYILEGILPAQIVGAIIGQGGVSKSFLEITLSIGLATGNTVLRHFEPVRPFKVLGLFAEDPQAELHRRVRFTMDYLFPEMSGEVRELLLENLHMKSVMGWIKPIMKLDHGNPEITEYFIWLRNTIEAHPGLEVLILDPKSRFYGLEENSNEHNTAWIACLEALVKDYGVAVLFSHHVSKQLHGSLAQGASRGGSALPDACRWVANLRPMDEAMAKKFEIENPKPFIEFDVSKNNYAPQLPRTIYFKRTENGVLKPINLEFHRLKDKAELLCSLLHEEHKEGRSFTRQELIYRPGAKEIREQMQCKRKDITDALDFALKEGWITNVSLTSTGGRPKGVLMPEISLNE